jgi:Uma2 family endonuclease
MAPATEPNTTIPTPRVRRKPRQHWVAWPNVGWKGYQALDRLRGGKATPKLIYLDGTVYLVAPLLEHFAKRLGIIVLEVAVGLDIPFLIAGQTTLSKKPKRAGVEGGQEFYFANHQRIAGKTDLDMNIDPPPDLVIEAVCSHPANKALEAYKRLQVPEVWIVDEDQLRILTLQTNGTYAAQESSLVFPFVQATELFAQIDVPIHSDLDWMKGVRRWVRDVLVPRVTPEEA